MTFKNKWKLYELINKEPYKSITELQNLIRWNRKKVCKYLKKLENDNMIKWKLNKIYPTPMCNFLDSDILKKISMSK